MIVYDCMLSLAVFAGIWQISYTLKEHRDVYTTANNTLSQTHVI